MDLQTNIKLEHYNVLPSDIYNKLSDSELKYIKEATYISRWINMIWAGVDFDYTMWANENDLKLIKKILM